jgi:hypothetical protein
MSEARVRVFADDDERRLVEDGWRLSDRDGLWRNDRFGGSYKIENALQRIGSRRGEVTKRDCPKCEGDGWVEIVDEETGGVIGPRPCPDCDGSAVAEPDEGGDDG